jgi:hypothetical protein
LRAIVPHNSEGERDITKQQIKVKRENNKKGIAKKEKEGKKEVKDVILSDFNIVPAHPISGFYLPFKI